MARTKRAAILAQESPYGSTYPASTPPPRPRPRQHDIPERQTLFLESSPPDFFSTASVPLFRIPKEIRDQIYGLVLDGSRFSIMEKSLRFHLAFGMQVPVGFGRDPIVTGLPTWILACKQLLSEVLSMLCRDGKCVSCSSCLWRKPSPFKLLPLHSLRTVDLQNEYITLDLKGGWRARNSGTSVMLPKHFFPGGLADHALRDLRGYMEASNHSGMDLTLSVSLPKFEDAYNYPLVSDTRLWKVDMTFLETLGTSFERVEFVVRAVSVSALWDMAKNIIQNLFIFYPLLQKELERVGTYMVGGEQGHGCRVRDWTVQPEYLYDQNLDEWHIEIARTTAHESERQVNHTGLRNFCLEGSVYTRAPQDSYPNVVFTTACLQSDLQAFIQSVEVGLPMIE